MEHNGKRLRFTPHAHDRRGEFGLSKADVRAIMRDPEADYPTGTPTNALDVRRLARKGEWAVVYAERPDQYTVITVLPAVEHAWQHTPHTDAVG